MMIVKATRSIFFVPAMAMMLAACGSTPDRPVMQGMPDLPKSFEGTLGYMQSDRLSPEEHKARVLGIIDKKSLKYGDIVIVKLGGDKYEVGMYRESSWDGFSLEISKGQGRKTYMSYSWNMVGDVLTLDEMPSLKKKYDAERMLIEAFNAGDLSLLHKAVAMGAELPTDEEGLNGLLDQAVQSPNNVEIIEFLLNKGANPNADVFGDAMVHRALDRGNGENALALVKAGADITQRNVRDRTVFMNAYYNLDYATGEAVAKLQALIDYLVAEKGVDPAERFLDPMYHSDNSLGMNGLRLLKLSESDCFALLDKYEVGYQRLEKTGEVQFPIQLTSPIRGISYKHTGNSDKFSVMDCRLAAALVGMVPVFEKYGVTTVNHMRAHSPGARIGGRGNVSGHHYALALDIASVVTEGGETYEIVSDWKDRRRGAEVCETQDGDSDKQRYLRNFICDTAKEDLFHWLLTPHYNKAHHDHLHIEIRDGVDYVLFQ